MKTMIIDENLLNIEQVMGAVYNDYKIQLSKTSELNIVKCRNFLDNYLKENTLPVYGINTGFGSLCDTRIGDEDLTQLQENLVKSHACGTGAEVPSEVVKAMLLLKIKGLSLGYSGVDLKTVQRLIWLYNNNVLPVIYTQGSLGASGDLAPLAHLSLPLLGLGFVRVDGNIQETAAVYQKHGLQPLKLQSKEGLALLNGTQFMSAYSALLVNKAARLTALSDVIACMSLEAYHGTLVPFDALLHRVRPHAGQVIVSNRIRRILAGSEMQTQKRPYVQDPYSFRCIPQVHGAILDTIHHIEHVVCTEVNSVTDNPTIFPDEHKVLSGGNFHGQPLAMAMDFLAVSLAELGSISERRTYKLISGTRGLPPFLCKNPGLNSGFMIPQYTAASIASRNKQLAVPCSTDTIDSSNGQEDHVSMGANAAVRTWEIAENVERLLAIELMNAAQAFEFRRPERSGKIIEKLLLDFRKVVANLDDDRELYRDIEAAVRFVRTTPFPEI